MVSTYKKQNVDKIVFWSQIWGFIKMKILGREGQIGHKTLGNLWSIYLCRLI